MEQGFEYSANLTGVSFLLYELKQVIKLERESLNNREIKEKVIKENIFQYKFTSSLKRIAPTIVKRMQVLDKTLKDMVLEAPLETGKAINLYAIMKTDKLFFEFMDEVIKEKLEANDFIIDKKDINVFFTSKAEQESKIAGWTENTYNKLRQVYFKLLFESGILIDKKSGTIRQLLIDENLRDHIRNIGDIAYLKAMGDDEVLL
ncbi:DUF1819 family protein [Salinicoccus roseus]|uniref:DUF1819 domain-containing protein n=1 Tax=Salinicoccus roseus TaxID=45670 RepID=A0A265E8A4_9STAP|nr:DUF1819 family protein [Salinicoccus roseus]OZT77508.1 hypothetical protein CFN03_06100 [Salinicoccus roseus]